MKKSDLLSVGYVILAAGNSVRFGKNKLLTELNGKLMIERAFDAIPTDKLCDIVVVTQYDNVAKLAERYGFDCVINRHPERGISHSVMLGTTALMNRCSGILYQVADQPWLKRESISQMLDLFRARSDSIVAMSSGGRRGNPCVFPQAYFDELLGLSGDIGGRAVIERHGDRLILFEVEPSELIDIDTPDDLTG